MICNDKTDEDREYNNPIIYSLPCRLGLWNDDLARQEDKNTITAYKKGQCQMLIQKTNKMMRNILKPTTLAIDTEYVEFGQNYQIKTSDLTKLKFAGSSKSLYLSGVITEKEIDICQHFKHGCMLTATPLKDTVLRNTFSIVGCNGEEEGEKVPYGQDVFLQIATAEGSPLYVQCENTTMDTFGNHLSLRLSRIPDLYCRFKLLHWDPQRRIETEGNAFRPDTRIIIQHTASGQNLAAETSNWILTLLGVECSVSCHTYRDSHKMETAENFWMLTGQPKIDMKKVVKAAKEGVKKENL